MKLSYPNLGTFEIKTKTSKLILFLVTLRGSKVFKKDFKLQLRCF